MTPDEPKLSPQAEAIWRAAEQALDETFLQFPHLTDAEKARGKAAAREAIAKSDRLIDWKSQGGSHG